MKSTAARRCLATGILATGILAAAPSAPIADEPTPPSDLTVRCDPPDRLFAHGSPARFDVTGPREVEWTWRVTDLDGEAAASGRCPAGAAERTIDAGVLRRGYYELRASVGGRPMHLAFGVVTDLSSSEPRERIHVDGATSWLEKGARHETLARMLRRIGVGWVRERFSWSGTERARGRMTWEPYDAVAAAFSRHGVRVYQVFHDSPAWSRRGTGDSRNPDDLRDVYRFARRVAEHYRGRVAAWEVWNEPDIFFWPDLSDTFSGVQKAAYLGFRRADPDLLVLLGSFCRGHSPFDDHLFAAGVRDYFDVFNWHIYAPPSEYRATLEGYLGLLARHGCEGRPVWLTEAGIRLRATRPDGELSSEDERRQADFVPISFAESLAAGTDRHFFFVLPYYLERGIQFGALRRDLSPRPALLAIAAAVDILGDARYLGRCPVGGPDGAPVEATDAVAQAFRSGRDRVLVVWSPKTRRVTLDVDAPVVRVANVVGRRTERRTVDGRLALDVGPSPWYVIGPGPGLEARLEGASRPAGRRPATRPHPVVVRGQALVDDLDKRADAYLIDGAEFGYRVEVCNLDEAAPARGLVRVDPPDGWRVSTRRIDVSLEPMGRLVEEIRVSPQRPSTRTQELWLRPAFEPRSPAPALSCFVADLARVAPVATRDLGLDDAARWRKNTSAGSRLEIRRGEDDGVTFEVEFSGTGDRWCFPRAVFSPSLDASGYDGILFEFRTSRQDGASRVRLQVVEPGGACYLTPEGWRTSQTWTQAACLFRDLTWGPFSPPDPDRRLDVRRIEALMAGISTSLGDVSLEVRNVRLARWEATH